MSEALAAAAGVALLTGGGTREPVDDVRWLGNVASGALPAAMAEVLLRRGWRVTYIHGPFAIRPGEHTALLPLTEGPAALEQALATAATAARAALLPGTARLRCVAIATAADAAAAVEAAAAAERPALCACAMAVADYRPRRHVGKLGSKLPAVAGDGPALLLPLDATEKVIDRVKRASPGTALLGFKLLSGADDAALAQAAAALAGRAGADWVFANDMEDYGAGRRCGSLRAPDGAVLCRLDGGVGAAALPALAEALVEAVLARLPAAALPGFAASTAADDG